LCHVVTAWFSGLQKPLLAATSAAIRRVLTGACNKLLHEGGHEKYAPACFAATFPEPPEVRERKG
jgi:hypothetical protein